ncbi:c-type cytochrome [Noviherbaspirillum soli]|uniref:c-type cytochrome n=1 Tax=Noviherbaspirillum soli TaxID=1064518 RepID=UPI00188DA737|nr:c-type cytochrome [Noviherbaspirillum soli]
MPSTRLANACLAIGLAVIAAQCPAAAQTQPKTADDAGRRLYASCAGCHGTEGKPAPGSSLPPLAGQSQDALVASMKAFQGGSRPSTIMQQLAKGYTSEQIDLIAAYLSQRKK